MNSVYKAVTTAFQHWLPLVVPTQLPPYPAINSQVKIFLTFKTDTVKATVIAVVT